MKRAARIAPACPNVMAPARMSCKMVGPSRRCSTIPKRPSTVTWSNTSGAGRPATKAARVMRASCSLRLRGMPALNSFTTWPGAQVWTSDQLPPPIFSPRDPRIAVTAVARSTFRGPPADAVEALLDCDEALLDERLELVVGEDVGPVVLDALAHQPAEVGGIDAADAGIVDQDVHVAVARGRRLGRRLQLGLERNIGAHTVDVGIGALELGDCGRQRLLLDVAQHDLRPSLGEGGGDAQSNA